MGRDAPFKYCSGPRRVETLAVRSGYIYGHRVTLDYWSLNTGTCRIPTKLRASQANDGSVYTTGISRYSSVLYITAPGLQSGSLDLLR